MVNIKQKRRELISETELGTKVYDKYKIRCDAFTNIPEELILSHNDVSKRVWIAGESRRTTINLMEYKDVGDNNFPEGGYVCKFKKESTQRSYNYDQVILNPDEIKKSKEQIEYEGAIKEAKKHKYENPLTGRMCSYKYSYKEGFITETGEKIELQDMKFENPETGRLVSYNYAKQRGII